MRFLIGFAILVLTATMGYAQNYTIQEGDVLSVEVIEDTSLNRDVLVLPDGNITFPFAGSVDAAGRTLSQVQANLRTALAPNFATTPTVFVGLSAVAAEDVAADDLIAIYVVGEVNAPGRKDVEPGVTFLQALAETGGFTPFAAKRRVQLRRADPSTGQEYVYRFDYRAVGDGARISGNSTLRDGDVILVPERRLFE